jgi:methylated-DNA-[protein]-cysteine S-methyltransferase
MKKLTRLKKVKDKDENWAAIIPAPFGKLGIKTGMFEKSLMLSEIFYVAKSTPLLSAQNELAENTIQQINQYFADPAFEFDLPMIPKGSLYQNHVWEQITKIPLGKVTTYGDLAKKLSSAPRAIGGACGANPYPLIVPCHRVVSASGIGGFAHHDEEGYHRNIKTWLLQHEGVCIN